MLDHSHSSLFIESTGRQFSQDDGFLRHVLNID